jgi:hypothetical protein
LANPFMQRVIEFLARKNPFPICEVCGSTDFGVPGDADGIRVNVPTGPPEAAILTIGTFIPAYVSFCRNCGHLRFHAASVVDPDIAAHEAGEARSRK